MDVARAENPNEGREKHPCKTGSKQVCGAGERKRDTPLRLWVLASHSDQAKTKQWGPFLNPWLPSCPHTRVLTVSGGLLDKGQAWVTNTALCD